MRRNFIVLLAVGFLMLVASPFVWRLNHRVHDVRLDVASVAYFMRAEVFIASTQGGFSCVISAIIALVRLKRAKGKFAQAKAVLPAVPVLAFAAASLAKLILVVPYIRTVYDTAPGFLGVPMTLRDYHVSMSLALAIGLLVFCCLCWPQVALIRRHQRAPLPTCDECGYSLRGLDNPRCPECGTGSDQLIPSARTDDDKA